MGNNGDAAGQGGRVCEIRPARAFRADDGQTARKRLELIFGFFLLAVFGFLFWTGLSFPPRPRELPNLVIGLGMVLMVDGLGYHVPKGYVYFSMAFALGVEMLNIRMRKRRSDVIHLDKPTEYK